MNYKNNELKTLKEICETAFVIAVSRPSEIIEFIQELAKSIKESDENCETMEDAYIKASETLMYCASSHSNYVIGIIESHYNLNALHSYGF